MECGRVNGHGVAELMLGKNPSKMALPYFKGLQRLESAQIN